MKKFYGNCFSTLEEEDRGERTLKYFGNCYEESRGRGNGVHGLSARSIVLFFDPLGTSVRRKKLFGF